MTTAPAKWSRCRVGLSAALLLLAAASLSAQYIVRPVNLTELAERASFIVEGRVVEAVYEGHPDYPNVPTVRVTLEVQRMIRGESQQRFSFREFLPGPVGHTGKPLYTKGQRLVLFLPQPSRYGLSSPLGAGQGRFRVERDAAGRDIVANEFDNWGLFRDVEAEATAAGLALTADDAALLATRHGPVERGKFISLVERLAARSRER